MGTDANVERATKLMRTFTAQIDALEKLRGKTPQRVLVEHVTINGSQAVLMDVAGCTEG
jgi:hypothetical protein